jgi:aminoglycoside phosphotransferase (APT) family kinase protein
VRDDAQTGNVGATISADAGFLPRDAVVERYAVQSGRDVSQLDFYEALAAYKLAIILEGIHARFLMGKTVGEGFDHIGSLVEIMVQGALDQCSRSSIAALRS